MSEYRTPLGMGPRVTPTTIAVRDLRPGDVIQDDTRRRTVKYLVHVLDGVWVAFEDGGDLIDRPPLEEVTRLIAADVPRPCPAEQLDNDGGDDPDQLTEALAARWGRLPGEPCHVPGVSAWRTDTRQYRCGHSVDDDMARDEAYAEEMGGNL